MDTKEIQKYLYSQCSAPIVIFNKAVIKYITYYGIVIWNDQEIPITPFEIDKLVNGELPSKFRYWSSIIRLNHDKLFQFYVPDYFGQALPLFYLVGCRKCPYCISLRSRDIQTRAMCENMTSKTHPISVLLTYNSPNLPSDGVRKDDIDLFLKRLRIGLTRDGHTNPLRFLLVSEYGEKRHRPHYHVIFWNFPEFSHLKYQNYVRVKQYIENYWQKGFVSVRYTDDNKNNSTAAATKYAVKYLYKGCEIPDGKNPTFMKCSRRPGLGSAWLELNKDYYLANSDTRKLIIVDKWSNTTHEATLPSYFVDKLFPAVSRLVPKEIRDIYNLFCRAKSFYNETQINEINEKYWFLPHFDAPLITPESLAYFNKNHIDLNKFVPESSSLVLHHTDFLIDLYDILLNYKIPPNLTKLIQQQKADFAAKYFDLLDSNKIKLENMLPYEFHTYNENLINIKSKLYHPQQSDEQ